MKLRYRRPFELEQFPKQATFLHNMKKRSPKLFRVTL